MRNFFLAITSFIATVVLLSQVALAQEDSWDAKHTTSAPGDEPLINLNAARSNGDSSYLEGSSPDSGENDTNPCTTCKIRRAHVLRRGDFSNPSKATPGSGDEATSSSGKKGEK